MRPFTRYGIVILFIIFSGKTYGQLVNLEFERFHTDDGLSQNHIFSIVQDHTGFLWFGTDDGLNRFDGHEFRVFKYSEADSNSIVDNSIRALMVARDSSIWIGTNSGVCRYFPKSEKIIRYPVDFMDPTKLSGSQVSSIRETADGKIWITYIGDGMNVITPGEKNIFHYTINRKDEYHIKNDLVSVMLPMPDGNKLLGSLAGLQVLAPSGLPLSDEEAKRIYPWIAGVDPSVKTILLSRDESTLWIATELGGLYRIDLITGQLTNYSKNNNNLEYNHVVSLLEDSFGNIWVGTEVIYIFIRETGELMSINEYGLQENEVMKNPIYSLFEDRDRNIWLGTQKIGVLKYNPQNKQVIHYHSNMGEGSIRSNQVISFAQGPAGNVWVGTDGEGLFLFDVARGRFALHPLQAKFSSKVIKTIYRDATDDLWIGTWDGGLMKVSGDQKRVAVFSPEQKNFQSHHVWAICSDRKGSLWLGTLRDGLCHFNPASGEYRYYRNIPGDSSSLANNDILSLLLDRNENLWVGAANGLSILPKGGSKFLNLYSDGSDTTLSGSVIQSLHEDNHGNIWAGTNGAGITVFSPSMKVIKVLKEKHGLPNNTICSLQPDLHGNIWAGTYKGLVKINPADFAIEHIPPIGGLREKEFGVNASMVTTRGKLLFGGSTGFDFFHPDSLEFRPSSEGVIFTSLTIFNHPISPAHRYDDRQILTRSITQADAINLSYRDYSFTLTFSPLTYNWQKTIHYAYQMENLDPEWQYTTSDRRFVHYSNLSPGNYVLKVKASYDGQNWSDEVRSLQISIASPWWATIWFKLGSGAFLGLLLVALYKVRVEFLERQQKKLGKLVDVRTSELQTSNEQLQVKNTQIAAKNLEIQSLLKELAKQKEDIEQKNEELQAQHDILALKSSALEKAQQRLQEINSNLENLIDRRTNKLNTAVRELETFLYRASHDLRGPISSMLGLIRVAELENGQRDQVYIDFLRKTTERLERTLGKLVQKHTIQKSKLTKELITRESLGELINEISLEIPNFRGHDLELRIPPSLTFETDRGMLAILLLNLLENAFFYSESASTKTVTLEVRQVPGSVIFTVHDHGIGIKTDVRDKIYTMFYRGSELSTGNGLGLYLVQNALLRVNGKLALETEEGQFTRFTFTLDSH